MWGQIIGTVAGGLLANKSAKSQQRANQAAIDAQQAALAVLRPGIRAEEVALAADEVYAERGYSTGYRTGRSIGVA